MTNTDYILPTKILHVKGVTFLIVFIPNLGDLHSKYFLVSMDRRTPTLSWNQIEKKLFKCVPNVSGIKLQ